MLLRLPRVLSSFQAYLLYFVIIGYSLVYPAQNYPFIWDDLHLIRHYPIDELLSTWYGPWDTDNVETIGFRPLTTLFNAIRYQLFGENVELHRLFLILLYAVLLTLLLYVAEKYNIPRFAGFLTLSLAFSSKYNSFHYVWISDGIHILQMLFCASAIICMIKGTDKLTIYHSKQHKNQQSFLYPGIFLLVASIFLALAALLVREDSLNTLICFPILVITYYLQKFSPANKNEYSGRSRVLFYQSGYIILLFTSTLFWWVYRSTIVTSDQPAYFNFQGFRKHFELSFLPHGLQTVNGVTVAFVYGWLVFLLVVAVYALVANPRSVIFASPWIICTLLAASSGGIIVRNNLLIAPTIFAMFSLAAIVHKFQGQVRTIVYLLLSISIIGAIYISQLAAQSFHPFSIETIANNAKTLYGTDAQKLTIPEVRRRMIEEQLAAVGIHGSADLELLQGIEQKAIEQKLTTPSTEPIPFVSKLPSLYHP